MKKYDLVVVGGGLTGVAAAVAAARQGLSVLLAEQAGCLGGALSGNLIYPFMPFSTCPEPGVRKDLSAGIFSEMYLRSQAITAKIGPASFTYPKPSMNVPSSSICPEHFKFALDDMVQEAGVDVLYHVTLSHVKTEGRNLRCAYFASKSGILELEADFFIDSTGDGDLLAFAGCDFQLGRESDGLSQPMTTCFRVANVDIDQIKWPEVQAAYLHWKEQGKITNPRENVLVFWGNGMGDGILHFNTTRVTHHDPTDPLSLSQAETKARGQVREMLEFFRTFPAFKNATIISTAAIGVRESRKLKGEHILTAQELMDCTKFDDAIALGNYDIDIHNPAGTGTSHYYFAPGDYYSIPYRSLLPKEFDNLLVGGRCISATHEAQASIRIMPICATTGEAAGIAAAVAKNTGTNTHTLDVSKVQSILRINGAAID